MSTPNETLMSGGSAPKAADWPSNGWTVEGEIITSPGQRQAREFDRDNPGGGKPKFYPSGDPVMELTIDIKTSLRDIGVPDDTGIRRIYMPMDKWRMVNAVRDAVRAAGAEGLEVKGWLSVTRTGTEPSKGGGTDATTWAATYKRPGTWTRPVAIPAGPPDWATGSPQGPAGGSVAAGAPNGYGQVLTQPQGAPAPVDVWSGQPTTQPAAIQPQPQATPAPGLTTKPPITASTAAALANAGIDISGYTIVPG